MASPMAVTPHFDMDRRGTFHTSFSVDYRRPEPFNGAPKSRF